ncbi:MAG: ATP-binding cassette domain-containing protein, partial [Candidatus Thiodiazotropha sp.]
AGGRKQRVAIARALANQPRILLMDEPFGALDAQTRARMQSYLLDIWKNVDVTILFITHDLDEAVYLADRILVLKAHPGEVQELIEVPVPHPRHPDQFLSPEFLATKARLETLIHPPQEEEVGLSEDHLNMVRMVPLDDEVSDVY